MISKINVYSIDNAINSDIDSKNAFIIANEMKKNDGKVGRYYTIFSSFDIFLKNRFNYKHCHELLIDHKNSNPNMSGRLVFDFDIKIDRIPEDFKNQIENTIYDVIELYMQNVDTDRLKFIWSSSSNTKKYSKHLTVKNMYFDDWIGMSKIFYKLFCLLWDNKFIWISSDKLVDFQIVRKHASLRMVGSSKIGGSVLIMDNPEHTLVESLIRIYQNKHLMKEQLVTKDNIIETVFDNILKPVIKNESFKNFISNSTIEYPNYDVNVYDAAFELCRGIFPNIFKKGKINGFKINLLRHKPAKCILSGNLHEGENAFLTIRKDENMYIIYFGCYRYCNPFKKTIRLGSLTIDNLIAFPDPNIK